MPDDSYHEVSRWRNFWLAADLWASALIWNIPGFTISGKTAEARAAGKTWGKVGCSLLNFLFRCKDHCADALNGDLTRAQKVEQEIAQYERDRNPD